MTMQTGAIQAFKIMTAALWFILGVGLGLVLHSLFTIKSTSDNTAVQFTNNSSTPIYAAVFLSDGHVAGASVEQGGDAFVTIHEGQISDPDFPDSMRVLIADDSNKEILNIKLPIVVKKGILVSSPVSFAIGESMEADKIVKTIELVIEGSETP